MKIPIDTYKELTEYISQFQEGVFELLIIEGKQGIGKTSVIKDTFAHLDPTTQYLWIEGRITAAALYKALYDYVDMPVILDDTDELFSDKQCMNLLKHLCQTSSLKEIQWNTLRMQPNLPKSFYTSSRVIILTNETKKISTSMKAIQDRGLHILFKPKKEEIHQKCQAFCDKEVYAFIERFLPAIEDLTFRLYVIANRAFLKGLEWKNTLLLSWDLDPLVKTFLDIEEHYTDKTRYEKQVLFCKLTNKTERTYERIIGQLKHQNIQLLSAQKPTMKAKSKP